MRKQGDASTSIDAVCEKPKKAKLVSGMLMFLAQK